MRISVTQEDIDAGKEGNCTRCPIATAMRRLLVGGALVEVGSFYVTIELGRPWHRRLPPEAVDFVRRFDNGRQVAPFAFELDIPEEALPCPWKVN